MKNKQKTRRASVLFTLAALVVVLMSNVYVGRAEEPDPRILWVADSSIGMIGDFTVHPNGNVYAFWYNNVYEIDGKTGKVISTFTIASNGGKSDISDDGKFLVTVGGPFTLTDLETKQSKIIDVNGSTGSLSFLPNSHKFGTSSPGGGNSNNNTIIIYDIDKETTQTITSEEVVRNIAFSPDGKYMATAGVKEKSDGHYYTVFKIWDAQKLTLIQELKKYDDENFQIPKIEFSDDNNLVSYFGDMGIIIFNTKELNIFKHYTKPGLGLNISRFTFIGSEYLGIQSEKTSILRFSNDSRIDIYEFPSRAFMMETNQNQSILYAGTGYSDLGGSIIAWDLNQIFSDVKENNIHFTIETNYHNDILHITGFVPISDTLVFEIFDINGKIINRINQQVNSKEISLPLVLPRGTYLLNLIDGNKEYSSKFIVTK